MSAEPEARWGRGKEVDLHETEGVRHGSVGLVMRSMRGRRQECQRRRPPPQTDIPPSENTKDLGVVAVAFDQHPSWRVQHASAAGKGTKWISQAGGVHIAAL